MPQHLLWGTKFIMRNQVYYGKQKQLCQGKNIIIILGLRSAYKQWESPIRGKPRSTQLRISQQRKWWRHEKDKRWRRHAVTEGTVVSYENDRREKSYNGRRGIKSTWGDRQRVWKDRRTTHLSRRTGGGNPARVQTPNVASKTGSKDGEGQTTREGRKDGDNSA